MSAARIQAAQSDSEARECEHRDRSKHGDKAIRIHCEERCVVYWNWNTLHAVVAGRQSCDARIVGGRGREHNLTTTTEIQASELRCTVFGNDKRPRDQQHRAKNRRMAGTKAQTMRYKGQANRAAMDRDTRVRAL